MSLTKRLNRVPYGRVLFAFVVGVVIIVLLKRTGKTSTYSVKEKSFAPVAGAAPGPVPAAADSCEMKAGTGLASSLLPREVASQEEFGEFAPEDILMASPSLSPVTRSAFETTGGALRNANQSIRTEPLIPRMLSLG